MTARLAYAGVLVALGACSWETTEPEAIGPRGVPRAPGETPVQTSAPRASAPVVEDPVPAFVLPSTEEPKKEEEEKERDYGADLSQALGSPVDCLAQRTLTDAPEAITINLEAYVMDSGGVGRAYASSAALAADELDCVRRRLEAVRLATPIEEAPRRVTSTIRLELKKPENPGR